MGLLNWLIGTRNKKRDLAHTQMGGGRFPSPATRSGEVKRRKLNDIESLAQDAWDLHSEACIERHVVQPSMPILYFGNAEVYRRSERRIITVGKNPSDREFPSNCPFQRFPDAERAPDQISSSDFYTMYMKALNRYFEVDPLEWFRSYEAILAGFDCSYYPGGKNTALHTDLFSPVATHPTWSKLMPEYQAELRLGGWRYGIGL